ncbi:hypothetical protein ACWCPM_27960 [Streptomyces sp. NPDC002309]
MRTFPADLARAQQEWSATYRQLTELPCRTELRRRLYRLSTRVHLHRHWHQRRPGPAVWRELRDRGRPALTGASERPRP